MKLFTSCLMAATLLVSCQDETSFEGSNEDLYKKRTEPKVTISENFANNNGNQNQVTTQQVPFDFGLSAVLGMGAFAAIRTAHQRRKQEGKTRN